MLKKTKIKILILLISIIIIGSYFFINLFIGNQKFSNFTSFLNVEQKELIKKYIFPHKTEKAYLKKELNFIKSGKGFNTEKSVVQLSNDKFVEKYKLRTKSKAFRVLLDYISENEDGWDVIFKKRRCKRC